MFNRKQYLAKECDFNTYYGQFVTPGLLNFVSNAIGENAIKQSTCEHFNDIPLAKWDNLKSGIAAYAGQALGESNASATTNGIKSYSLSDCVCVAKAAASQIRGR